MKNTVLKTNYFYTILLAGLLIAACTGVPQGLLPVTGFDAQRYLGTWYEVARLDHRFERNLSHVSAFYDQGEKGEFIVINRGFDFKTKKWRQVSGRARFIQNAQTGSLKVSFFGPFYGGYHIIALDKSSYGYAMVAGPSRSYLWILARKPFLDEKILTDLVATARKWGFDTDQLIYVKQDFPEKKY